MTYAGDLADVIPQLDGLGVNIEQLELVFFQVASGVVQVLSPSYHHNHLAPPLSSYLAGGPYKCSVDS